ERGKDDRTGDRQQQGQSDGAHHEVGLAGSGSMIGAGRAVRGRREGSKLGDTGTGRTTGRGKFWGCCVRRTSSLSWSVSSSASCMSRESCRTAQTVTP